MLTFFIVFFGLSFLILAHEAGHFFVAKKFGLKVDEFGIGFPPRMFSWQPKGSETRYSVNWLPLGGFVKIAGENAEVEADKALASSEEVATIPREELDRYFFAQPAGKRALVIAAGIIINFVLGWLLITAVFMVGTPPLLLVGDVDPSSPAAAAGLMKGDVVKEFSRADDLIGYISSRSPGEPAEFSVSRGGELIGMSIVPVERDGVQRIGVRLDEGGAPKLPLFRALYEGLLASFRIAWMTILAFGGLVRNLFVHASLMEGIVGPVGIFTVAAESSQFGLIYLLQLLGLISVNLAIANLIPFPALDGGRLLLIMIEKIKGSPVPKRLEGILNGVGFVFLLLIMLLVTVRDVSRWF